MGRTRNLVLVLGDQLDLNSAAFDGFEPALDAVWMAEVTEEAEHVWSHKVRIALFLTSMRHFAESAAKRGYRVHYRKLDDNANRGSLAQELTAALATLEPKRVIAVEPGEWRVERMLDEVARQAGVPLVWRADRHFFCSRQEFAAWAKNYKQLRMEFFYREMRRRTGFLMEDHAPVGGRWNFDADNRGSFGRKGPPSLPKPLAFAPDAITNEVTKLVNERFSGHPGTLDHFDFPVTPAQARQALRDFVEHRLPTFGTYQDAMWEGEAILFHSRLSALMNLKLLDPRDVVDQAEQAYRRGDTPLASVEGFIRQILGWREYVRGVYWTFMPAYAERNELHAEAALPDFYWTAETDMNCLRQVVKDTLAYGYAHHIQRLMVTGLYALLLGVKPIEVHKWYLAIYYDAVEWVELPNTLGMSQFSDGGIMGSKPYVASGKYIERMSNYCRGCRYRPSESVGDAACPFTTLYWDFLMRHEEKLSKNRRMDLQLRNLRRFTAPQREAIRGRAQSIKDGHLAESPSLLPTL